jgi:probable rRNA maturation factor
MPLTIEIQNLQKRIPISPPRIKRTSRRILKGAGVSSGSLSLVFVTNRKIRDLNKKFLRHDFATDVLSFDLRDIPGQERRRKNFIHGEIVISAEMAASNARRFETPVARELELYIIHGILHLLGYNDHAPKDIKKMRAKEQELMNKTRRDYV